MRWLAAIGVAIAGIALAFVLSPWPSVYLIRMVFDKGAAAASEKLEKHVPAKIAMSTFRYDPADEDAYLDALRPAESTAGGPVIVWIHGGGFVSGRRGDLTNYLKVLAGRGFTVVNVDYTIAPEAAYPTPIRQVSKALAFLAANEQKLGIEGRRFVVAGDSAGAQIAAQTAAVTTDQAYARLVGVEPGLDPSRLAGALLYCGVYDVTRMGGGRGILGWFVDSTAWAYSGKKDWRSVPGFKTMSVTDHLTAAFPPAFVSAGNADPLGPQSVELAIGLKKAEIPVETLFFSAEYEPPLGHEYQFDLDTPAGKLALEKSVAWLRQR